MGKETVVKIFRAAITNQSIIDIFAHKDENNETATTQPTYIIPADVRHMARGNRPFVLWILLCLRQ